MIRRQGVMLFVALVAASCSSSGLGTPAGTLERAQAGSQFGYVIDEVPAGYELCSVGTFPGLSVQPDGVSLFVYGNGALADPYDGPLYGLAMFPGAALGELDLGDTVRVQVGDRAARLGGMDGLLLASLPASAGRVLTFNVDDGRTVQLSVRGDDEVDLVHLAGSVVVTDDAATLALDALPSGYVSLGDLYALDADAEFLFTVDYRFRAGSEEPFGEQIALLGTSGTGEAFRSFRFRADSSEARSVNGYPGIVAEVGRDDAPRRVVSWLVDDHINLRLFSTVLSLDDLFAVAASVRRVEGDEWATLRESHDPGTCSL